MTPRSCRIVFQIVGQDLDHDPTGIKIGGSRDRSNRLTDIRSVASSISKRPVLPGGVACTSVRYLSESSSASSFFTRPAADESAAVFAPPPASDPARYGSPGDARQACPVLERDLADGTVQVHVVAMLDVAFTKRRASSGDNGVPGPMHSPLERFVPRFDFSVEWGY